MKLASGVMIVAVFFVPAGCEEQENGGYPATKKNTSPQTADIVLVSMAGWTQTADTMEAIESEMVRQLSACLPNHRISVKRRLLGLLPEGDSELFLSLEYEAWKQKKKTPAGQNDLFIAVGHSSGATAIYSLLRNGTFRDGVEAPAFLGLVDMVLPLGPHDLTGTIPRNGARRTVVVHYHLYETEGIGGIQNVLVGGDHFSIVNSGTVLQGLAAGAVAACRENIAYRQAVSSRQKISQNEGQWQKD